MEVEGEMMSNDERLDMVNIDVSMITNSEQLHDLLKQNLDFPQFYGMNWDAFWDAITGLVEMPKKLVINGWENLEKQIPNDAQTMKKLLEKLNKDYPEWGCEIYYG
jgi:ribonuclease inhibitor